MIVDSNNYSQRLVKQYKGDGQEKFEVDCRVLTHQNEVVVPKIVSIKMVGFTCSICLTVAKVEVVEHNCQILIEYCCRYLKVNVALKIAITKTL